MKKVKFAKVFVYVLLVIAMVNVKMTYNHTTEGGTEGKKDFSLEVSFTPEKIVDLLLKKKIK